MILFCPDLVGKEDVKAVYVGHGDFVRPVLNPCIKEECVAYKDGYCEKYHNKVEGEKEKNERIREDFGRDKRQCQTWEYALGKHKD